MTTPLRVFGPRASLLGPALAILLLSAPPSSALINGSEDTTNTYGAAAWFRGGCSSVLVAPRVMLTSAHCLPDYAMQCTTLAQAPLSVTFAEPGGGWANQASFDARTVMVQSFTARPEIFDLSSCSPSDAYNCNDFVDPDGGGPLLPPYDRHIVDHSKELVVMYLAADAPGDVAPLPVLVHPNASTIDSAAVVGTMGGIAAWVLAQERVVTTVGYGVGSHGYIVGGQVLRGRDYGLQRWVDTQTDFDDYLGLANCNTLVGAGTRTGVMVSPRDLTPAQVGDAKVVPPGADFSPSQHSHSGGGDSGGPVLAGYGIAARGEFPTALPRPSATYNPNLNYVVGTASLWVGYGGEFATAFTPIWTLDASNFLMAALHDTDGDGYADPVDDDLDGDGCNNGVDQHPFDRWVPVGTIYYLNCSPSSEAYLGDESLDIEPDGLRNCIDNDDDNDGIDDWPIPLDMCPVDADQFCFQFGPPCPWNPIFFDCVFVDCNDLVLRLSSLVNPDPTEDLLIPVLSSSPYEVVVGAIEGMTLDSTVQALLGEFAGGAAQAAEATTESLTLEVESPSGEVLLLAVYEPGDVIVGDLRGANALVLRFDPEGGALVIEGTVFVELPVQGWGGLAVLLIALGVLGWVRVRRVAC